MNNKLGELVCEKREGLGLSRRRLAELIDISHTELARIESGARDCPSIKVLYRLSNVLGISMKEIFEIYGYNLEHDEYNKGYLDGYEACRERVLNVLDRVEAI